ESTKNSDESPAALELRATFLPKVEKAKPRNAKLFEQTLLQILLLDQSQLLGFHLAAVCRESAVHFAANSERPLFAGIEQQPGMNAFIEDGQASFQIFQVQRTRRFEQHRAGLQPAYSLFQCSHKRGGFSLNADRQAKQLQIAGKIALQLCALEGL